MKKIFHHEIRLRIKVYDCRNIINLIVHRRITLEWRFRQKPNTQRNQTLSWNWNKVSLPTVAKKIPGEFCRESTKTDGLDNIIKAYKKRPRQPEHCRYIYIDANGSSLGVATLDRIHRALKDFQRAITIYAYADDHTQREYLLSAIADSVVLNPVGAIDFRGLASQIMFVKGLYDKLGIEVQVLKVGTYKSKR